MLLKSSDRIAHDICHAFDHCIGASPPPARYVLALRKWRDLRPESEFRAFVRDHRLVAISQRDLTQHCRPQASQQSVIREKLREFHAVHVKDVFSISDCKGLLEARDEVTVVVCVLWMKACQDMLVSWEECFAMKMLVLKHVSFARHNVDLSTFSGI